MNFGSAISTVVARVRQRKRADAESSPDEQDKHKGRDVFHAVAFSER